MDINVVEENVKSFSVPFLNINKDIIRSLLSIAFERAILHWCHRIIRNYENSGLIGLEHIDIDNKDWSVKIITDDGEECIMNKDSIKTGLYFISKDYPDHFLDLIVGNCEDDLADAFVQCCLFEEVIY